jgi:DNA-binding beta-propeller fold protein YncE
MRLPLFGLIALGFLSVGWSSSAEIQPSAYHVVKKIPLGEEGGWDYLSMDSEARRLYITRMDRVIVMDADTGQIVGKVANTPGIHGVALVPKLNKGYSSNGRESTVTVFDLKTLEEKARIKVGQRPDAIIYDPASERVFTFNAGSKDATAIDVAKDKVAGSVPLGGKPEFAVADDRGMVYVNLEDKDQIVGFDSHELKERHRFSIAPGKAPAGLAMDRKQRRLFSTCHNEKMIVLNADDGKVIATPTIGKGTDACIFDPDTALAFSSNGDGTLTIVHQDTSGQYRVAANVQTQRGARTMALDLKGHQIFLATARAIPGQRRKFEPGSFTILVVGQ